MPKLKRRPASTASDEELAAMRQMVRAGAANRPGIYRMLAEDGEIVYVGKSKKLRSRLLSYFRCDYPGDKGARIVREARRIEWSYAPSEFAALLDEMHCIKRFRPRLNVAMKRDVRHYAFIRITRGAAPKLVVTRGPGGDPGGTFYGPFVGAQRLGEALRELSDTLGLRDCASDTRMSFSDQPDLFPMTPRTPGCIRYEIGKCLGPCIAAVSADAYSERVRQARAFLDGASNGPLETLRAAMLESSERLEFERAGALRNKLQRVEALREQFDRLRFAVESLSFAYTVPGHEGDDRTYLIRRGRVHAEHPAPRSAAERRSVRELAERIYHGPDHSTRSVPAHEVDELLLLSAWFRRFPAELKRTKPITSILRPNRSPGRLECS